MSVPTVKNVRKGRPRKGSSMGVPRLLPWVTMLGRTWAGTLIVCWTALTSALLIKPTWVTVGAVAAVLAVGSLIARVPVSAVPRAPVWLLSGLVGGMIGAWLGDGLVIFLRAVSVTILVLWGSALLLWTVPTRRLAAAIRSLLAPLKWVGVPVDEWAQIMGLALRSLPVLRDQTTAVMDTAKLRVGADLARLSLPEFTRMSVDVVTATLSVASRGAADTGRAMSMRGGSAPIERERVALGWRDFAVFGASGAAIAAVVIFA